jgi:hypothetical protein
MNIGEVNRYIGRCHSFFDFTHKFYLRYTNCNNSIYNFNLTTSSLYSTNGQGFGAVLAVFVSLVSMVCFLEVGLKNTHTH